MSIPLDRLYYYIENIAEEIYGSPVIIYRFFPHGSKKLEHLEPLKYRPWNETVQSLRIHCNDQEPLTFDFYKNYGVWRHIFHKGSAVDTNTPINYQSWETLASSMPDQTIGVWIAPFTNNLRVAISTTTLQGNASGSYPDAFIQKCNPATGTCMITDLPSGKWLDTSRITDGSVPATRPTIQLEYFEHDIQSIPINTKVTFTVNIIGNYVELFMNGKIVKTAMLNGVANFNKAPIMAIS